MPTGNSNLMIATPVSDLFKEPTQAKQIEAFSDCLEGRDSAEYGGNEMKVYHSDLQPIHELAPAAIDGFKDIIKRFDRLKLITFHLASACDAPNLSGYMFIPGGRQLDRSELLENARKNIKMIRSIIKDQVMIGVENNNYYPTEAYRHVTDPEFIDEIVKQNNVFLLLDLAHAKISCRNREVSYQDYLTALPLEKVIQIHVSSPAFDEEKKFDYDAHEIPEEADLREAVAMSWRCPALRYITVEYYRDALRLVSCLKLLKGMINELS